MAYNDTSERRRQEAESLAEVARVIKAVPPGKQIAAFMSFAKGALSAGGAHLEAVTKVADLAGLLSEIKGNEEYQLMIREATGSNVVALPRKPQRRETDTQQALMDELMNTDFPPIAWVIPEIIVEGVTLLAAKPKVGKSWLALHAAHAVATGGYTLGDRHCFEGDTLYCALEDNHRRIQSRMRKMFGHDVRGSSRVSVLCDMPKLVDGGLDVIRTWIGKAELPRLVILDTIAMLRVSKKREDTAFQADYDAIKDLRTLANERHIAIILVWHLRKAGADDPFDEVSGTLGLTAAVDTILVIRRDTHGNYTLHGRGRDLENFEKAIVFNASNCAWTILGDAAEVNRSAERNSIITALTESAAEMTIREISDATGLKGGKLRLILHRMVKKGEAAKEERGKYSLPTK